jgi:hypothetical protein
MTSVDHRKLFSFHYTLFDTTEIANEADLAVGVARVVYVTLVSGCV